MPFVSIDGLLLHYQQQGPADAPVLALVNSLGTDARIWTNIVDRLSTRYRVITYDKRGHGLSDAPDGDYSLDQHVTDLIGILDHLKIDRLALAGVSVGGLIAQALALRYGERLEALILCDSAAKVGDEIMWNERITQVKSKGMTAIAGTVMMRWFSDSFRQDQPEALRGWRNMLLRTPVAGYAGTCATLRDSDLRNYLGGIAVPTLVVVGDQDRATSPDLVRSTAQSIPGARFEVIERSGHIPPIEQPEALGRLFQSFLDEVGHV